MHVGQASGCGCAEMRCVASDAKMSCVAPASASAPSHPLFAAMMDALVAALGCVKVLSGDRVSSSVSCARTNFILSVESGCVSIHLSLAPPGSSS